MEVKTTNELHVIYRVWRWHCARIWAGFAGLDGDVLMLVKGRLNGCLLVRGNLEGLLWAVAPWTEEEELARMEAQESCYLCALPFTPNPGEREEFSNDKEDWICNDCRAKHGEAV